MKLVAAKCPSCGANIEVDSKTETTKCKYCKQAILIDDAIAKYKLEISGEVEIKNLPKIDNFLKIANRNFNNKDYEEAYNNYNEVIKLDADNTLALLRYSICKSYLNNSIDFQLTHLLNTFKNVVDLLKKNNKYDEEIEKYIDDVITNVDYSKESTIDYYNKYSVTRTELADIQSKLKSCLSIYQELYDNATEIEKEQIAKKIVLIIDDILAEKHYKTGFDEYGKRVTETYKPSFSEKNKLIELKKKYISNETIENEEQNENNSTIDNSRIVDKKKKINVKGILNAVIIITMLAGIIVEDFVKILPLPFLIILINCDKNKSKLFKKYPWLYTTLIIVFSLLFLILMGS